MTLSRQESLADRLLRQQGYNTFFPHTAAWVAKDPRKLDLVKTAMLPRYLFVELGEKPEFWRVNETPGVATVVYAPGGIPWPISPKAIELLSKDCDPSGLVYGKPKGHGFLGIRGDSVRLGETTPYFGFMAEILGVDTDGRISIELNSFGRMVPVTIKPKDVSELLPKRKVAG
jgi:transcription antitermination factor NusG